MLQKTIKCTCTIGRASDCGIIMKWQRLPPLMAPSADRESAPPTLAACRQPSAVRYPTQGSKPSNIMREGWDSRIPSRPRVFPAGGGGVLTPTSGVKNMIFNDRSPHYRYPRAPGRIKPILLCRLPISLTRQVKFFGSDHPIVSCPQNHRLRPVI